MSTVAAPLVLPEVLEPVGAQLRVPDRVLDVLVAHVMLNGSSVLSIVGELVARRVAKHMRMNKETNPGILASSSEHLSHG